MCCGDGPLWPFNVNVILQISNSCDYLKWERICNSIGTSLLFYFSSKCHHGILIVIYIARMYDIGCCIFRWQCENIWASGLLGAEELATSGDNLTQLKQYLNHLKLILLLTLLMSEVWCNLENHTMHCNCKSDTSNWICAYSNLLCDCFFSPDSALF